MSKGANPVPVGCPRPLLGLHLSSAPAQFCFLPVLSTSADLKRPPLTPCTLTSISESALQEANLGNYYEEGDYGMKMAFQRGGEESSTVVAEGSYLGVGANEKVGNISEHSVAKSPLILNHNFQRAETKKH